MQPPLDVATFIAGNVPGLSLHSGATGNVFTGLERPASDAGGVPSDAVFCTGASGGLPTRVHSLVVETRFPIVTTRIRASKNGIAETWARQIQDLFQSQCPPNYMDIRCLQSEPSIVYETKSLLIRCSLVFELVYENELP